MASKRLAVFWLVCCLSFTLSFTGRATAQVPPPAPPPNPLANPASVVPQGSPLERDRQPLFPQTAPGLPSAGPLPAVPSTPGQTARIGSAVINGATILKPDEPGQFLQGLTGPAVPLSAIETQRQALLARYRDNGYLLSTVSTVIDRNGNLRFDVVEGYIADVKLDGDIGPAGTQVLRFLDRIKAERPVRVSTIERYLLLATDVPGITVRSVLRPSTDNPAAITLIAQVTRKAFDGLLTADNRAFPQTGPEQLLAVANANSFTQFGERTEVSILHSFNNTQTFGEASEEFFLGSSGLRARVYGGVGGTNPSGELRPLGYDGRTRVFGAQLTYPIIRSRQQTLLAIGAFDALESDIHTDTGQANAAIRASFDSVRVLRAGFDYALQDLVLGGDRTGINNVGVRFSRGLTWLGATQAGDPQAGRVGSTPNFFKFSAELSRTQTLYRPTADSSIALFGLVAGQVSDAVLTPSEKFFLGGIRYNRGFYAGEVTGDNALTATAELQYNVVIPVDAFSQSVDVNAQFYLFHDWGETWENQQQDPNRRLRSFGLGVRSQITPYLGLEVEGVSRVTRRPLGDAATVSALKADAVYWRVISRF